MERGVNVLYILFSPERNQECPFDAWTLRLFVSSSLELSLRSPGRFLILVGWSYWNELLELGALP